MEKTKHKKPFIVKLFIGIFSVVLVLGAICVGGYYYINSTYGIDLISVYKQLNTLNEKVTPETKFTNQFADTDMISAQSAVNAQVPGLVVYSATDGYTISTEGLTTPMTSNINLTDKEIGAIIDNLIISKSMSSVTVGDYTMGLDLLQISFSNITSTAADVQAVVKLDLTSIKSQLTSFPLNIVDTVIPKNIYVSSITTITHGDTAYSYSVTSKTLEFNNLTNIETVSLLETMNKFVTIGTANDLNVKVGTVLANALIGTTETPGLAREMNALGCDDYAYSTISDVNYFVFKHN